MDRDAVRAYLQRAENRLAILNTIATAFVGGAALIVLGPFLFKEIILSTIANVVRVPAASSLEVHWLFGLGLLGLMTVLLILVLIILCTILRQIVRLYFLPPQHNNESRVDLPRFVLWPVTFPVDDDKDFFPQQAGSKNPDILTPSETKKSVLRAFFHHDFHMEIISSYISKENRRLHAIFVRDFFDQSLNRFREQFLSEEFKDEPDSDRVREDTPSGKARMLNVFSSLAGVRDRTLLQEAARMEALLVRFHLQIRIVLIRYFQGLLVFFLFWGVLLVISSLAEQFHDLTQRGWFEKQDRKDAFVSLFFYAAFFCIQFLALFVPIVTRLPLKWIFAGKHVENPTILSMLDDRFVKLDQRAGYGGLALSVVCTAVIFGMFFILQKRQPNDALLDTLEIPLLGLSAFVLLVQTVMFLYILIPLRRSNNPLKKARSRSNRA